MEGTRNRARSALAVASPALAIAVARARDRTATRRRHEVELAPLLEQAHLAAQLEVSMEASAIADRLSAVAYVMGTLGHQDLAGCRPLAGLKATLSTDIQAGCTFLWLAARRWERERRTSDLHRDVELVIDDGAAAVLLTADQAAQLRRELDALRLCGTVAFTAVAGDRLPGDRLVLAVGDRTVVLDATLPAPGRGRERRPAGGAGWCGAPAAALAAWSVVAAGRHGRLGRRHVVGTTVVTTLAAAAALADGRRQRRALAVERRARCWAARRAGRRRMHELLADEHRRLARAAEAAALASLGAEAEASWSEIGRRLASVHVDLAAWR